MTTPPTAPQSRSVSARALHAWHQLLRWCSGKPSAPPAEWITISLVGVLVLLFAVAPIVFLGDWLGAWQLIRVWTQLVGACVALMLAGRLFRGTDLNRSTRSIMLIGPIVLILILYDSLDGQQDVFTNAVCITSFWSCIFATETDRIARQLPAGARWRRVGLIVGILAMLVYTGSAIAYAGYNLGGAPLDSDYSLFNLVGIFASAALRWIKP